MLTSAQANCHEALGLLDALQKAIADEEPDRTRKFQCIAVVLLAKLSTM